MSTEPRLSELQQAEVAWLRSSVKELKDAGSLKEAGRRLLDSGEHFAAEEAFRRALAINQKDAEAWRGLKTALQLRGADPETRALVRTLLKLQPTSMEKGLYQASRRVIDSWLS